MPYRRNRGPELLFALVILGGCPHEPAPGGGPELSKCTVTLSPGTSIADHLDAGGVICLQAGVYPGALFIEKSVEIRGVPGSVVDGGGRGAAVRVGTDDVVAL